LAASPLDGSSVDKKRATTKKGGKGGTTFQEKSKNSVGVTCGEKTALLLHGTPRPSKIAEKDAPETKKGGFAKARRRVRYVPTQGKKKIQRTTRHWLERDEEGKRMIRAGPRCRSTAAKREGGSAGGKRLPDRAVWREDSQALAFGFGKRARRRRLPFQPKRGKKQNPRKNQKQKKKKKKRKKTNHEWQNRSAPGVAKKEKKKKKKKKKNMEPVPTP